MNPLLTTVCDTVNTLNSCCKSRNTNLSSSRSSSSTTTSHVLYLQTIHWDLHTYWPCFEYHCLIEVSYGSKLVRHDWMNNLRADLFRFFKNHCMQVCHLKPLLVDKGVVPYNLALHQKAVRMTDRVTCAFDKSAEESLRAVFFSDSTNVVQTVHG